MTLTNLKVIFWLVVPAATNIQDLLKATTASAA
jgi:hypothetical protein